MASRRSANWWTLWGLLILLWALFPLLWMVSLSFKDPATFRGEKPTFFPKEWTWKNYDTVFSDSLFTSALRNSAGIALIATGLSVIVAMFAAYAIARLDFPQPDGPTRIMNSPSAMSRLTSFTARKPSPYSLTRFLMRISDIRPVVPSVSP